MAQVVSAVVVSCPLCTSQAIVRVWSCGCQEVVSAPHRTYTIPVDLRKRVPFPIAGDSCDNDYFKSFERSCGQEGPPAGHGASPAARAAPKRFE
jgi:hypothetical protein